MKLNKSTTILLNVVLILVALFIIKAIIGQPKNAYAAGTQYELVQTTGNGFLAALNDAASKGWSVAGYTFIYNDDTHHVLLKN